MSIGEANVWNPRTLIEVSADTKAVEERITASSGQTLFTLQDFVYVIGTGALSVHKNGALLTKGVDWAENTDTTFTIVLPTVAGDQIVASGLTAITGNVDVRDTDIFVANYQAVRDYAGTEISLYVQGTVVHADGGQKFFEKLTGFAPGSFIDDNLLTLVPTGGDGSIGWVAISGDKVINLVNTTTLGTISFNTATTGFKVITEFFDTNRETDSGATLIFTGVTTVGKAGNIPDADGSFYDAIGKKFSVIGDLRPEKWGAYSDGTVVTSAFNSMFASAIGTLNRKFIFKPVNYVIDALNTISNIDNLTLEGNGAIFLALDSFVSPSVLFTFDTCTDLTIRSIEFNRRNSFVIGSMSAMTVTDCTDVLVEHCIFDECSSGAFVNGTFSSGVKIINNRMIGRLSYSVSNDNDELLCSLVVYFFANTNTECQVRNNLVTRAFHLNLAPNIDNAVFDGNIIEETFDSSIYVQGGPIVITNNIIIDSGKDGIKVVGNAPERAIVTDNYVSRAGLIAADGGRCIQVEGPFSTVTGNVVELAATADVQVENKGIFIQNSNITVDGNTIYNLTTNEGLAIILDATALVNCIDFVISNNTINKCATGISGNDSGGTGLIQRGVVTGNNISEAGEGISFVQTTPQSGTLADIKFSDNSMYSITSQYMNIQVNRTTICSNSFYDTGSSSRIFRVEDGTEYLIYDNYAEAGSPIYYQTNSAMTYIDKYNNYEGDTLVDDALLITSLTPTLHPTISEDLRPNANTITATLADGTYPGQTKFMRLTNSSNACTVSVTSHETSNPEVFTFSNVGEYLSLQWAGTEWITIKTTATV